MYLRIKIKEQYTMKVGIVVAEFERLLSYMRAVGKSKNDQGIRFEQLIKKFFLVSPLYSQLYENVWLWNEFPYNGNKHD